MPGHRSAWWVVTLALGAVTSGCTRAPGEAKPPPAGSTTSVAAPSSAGAAEASPTQAEIGPPPAPVAAALDALKRDLAVELKAAMERGGPIEALGACQLRAPRIAAAVTTPALRVGRTSHKLRNPANAPPAWAADAVAAAPGTPAHKLAPRQHFDAGDGRRGYLEAIRVATPCLACHGPLDDLAPDVRARLRERYPSDAATGFAAGDLRGWFWAEYDGETRRAP